MQLVRNQSGFTLIEVMIVVVIISILVAIALPSYANHVMKTRRAAATACLMEGTHFLERYYTTRLTYTGATWPGLGCAAELAQFYTFRIQAGTLSATTFTAEAVPLNAQARRDTQCSTLRIDHIGRRTVTGTAVENPGRCF